MRKRGFTLIELLVVIAVIGLLASIVLVSVNSAREKARNVRRLSDIQQYVLAIELAYDKNEEYPDPGDTISYCLGDYSDDACWRDGTDSDELVVLNAILDDYIASLPADEMLICGWMGTQCYEGYLYRCEDRTDGFCRSMAVEWFMEGSNQSCGTGRDYGQELGYPCTNCTFCIYQ